MAVDRVSLVGQETHVFVGNALPLVSANDGIFRAPGDSQPAYAMDYNTACSRTSDESLGHP
jgi:hypothetical protein